MNTIRSNHPLHTWFRQRYFLPLILIVSILIFSRFSPLFLTVPNFKNILTDNSHIFIMAFGLSLVMGGGGIDFSIGYQVSIVASVTSIFLQSGVNPWLSMLAGLGLGLVCGCLNGIAVAYLDIEPYIATLGTQIIFKGMSYIISKNHIFTLIPRSFQDLMNRKILNINFDLWIVLFCFIVTTLLLHYTYYGCYIKALAENEQVLSNCKISPRKIKASTYILASLFYALQAFVLISKKGFATPSVAVEAEVTGILAIYFGGIYSCSLYQSKGLMASLWLLLGTFTLVTIENGIQLAGWGQFVHYVIEGCILLCAIRIWHFQHPRRSAQQ